jgi:hypothetical protein
LNLALGVNCVFLRHNGLRRSHVVASATVANAPIANSPIVNQAGSRRPHEALDRALASVSANVDHSPGAPSSDWAAVIAPADSAGVCHKPDSAEKPFDVVAFGDSPADSIPRAARFIEGKSLTSFIGVKCADAWCVIGPNVAASLQPSAHSGAFSVTAGPKQGRRTDDALWFDDQHLAVFDKVNPKKLVPGFRASIVPDTGLRNKARDYKSKWYPVAYLYAPSTPPKKYEDGFGLRTGWNEFRLRQINGIWFAMVVSPDGSTHVRDIQPMEHTFGDVPGTVRFDWLSLDDWVWVPCLDGCCLVQDGRDS